MLKALLLVLLVSMGSLSGNTSDLGGISAGKAPRIGEIERNAKGRILFLHQLNAIKHCAKQGKRLPTAREWAQWAASRGAAGISETPNAKDGYYLVSARNNDGIVDKFYFKYSGYDRPWGDLGDYWFWSSSAVSMNAFFAYAINGETGIIDIGDLGDVRITTRCAF